jgi:WD40 repeat protein
VRSLRFSRDDRSVVSVTDDGVISVWELASGRQINTPGGQNGGALDADLSADWSWVLVAQRFGNLTLYEATTGEEIRKLEPETVVEGIAIRGAGHAACVLISADGRFAAAGYQDGKVRLWALPEGRCVRTLTGHDGPVRSVTGSADGRFLMSAGEDGTLCSWELKWEYHLPEVVDWDEGARPYLECFLTAHCSEDGLSRARRPVWNNKAFGELVSELKLRGYGWLRPEGVKHELEMMAANWEGPPPLPGE